MRRSVGIVLIALGCCIAPHVAGQVYRCTEGGKTVYSDRPWTGASASVNVPVPSGGSDPPPINPGYEANMGRIVVGQTPQQVERAWGQPKTKNIETGSAGRTEQWVYERPAGTAYVYFREGVVSSWSQRAEGSNAASLEPLAPAPRQLTRAEMAAQDRADKAGERKFVRERTSQSAALQRIGEPDSKSFSGGQECWYYAATRLDPQTNTKICFTGGLVFYVDRMVKQKPAALNEQRGVITGPKEWGRYTVRCSALRSGSGAFPNPSCGRTTTAMGSRRGTSSRS